MQKNTLPRLTRAEFDIMDAVWSAGQMTVTEILNKINFQQKRNLKRATIQVQVGRLEEKGWLTHHQEANKFIFKATVPRTEASASIVLDIGDRVFGGSCFEYVKTLFDVSDISPEEIRQLRELIDKYEE